MEFKPGINTEGDTFANYKAAVDVATEQKVKPETVLFIAKIFGKFVKHNIESGEFRDITIPYIGKLKFNKKKFDFIMNKQKELDNQ